MTCGTSRPEATQRVRHTPSASGLDLPAGRRRAARRLERAYMMQERCRAGARRRGCGAESAHPREWLEVDRARHPRRGLCTARRNRSGHGRPHRGGGDRRGRRRCRRHVRRSCAARAARGRRGSLGRGVAARPRTAQALVEESGLDHHPTSGIAHAATARVAVHETRPEDARAALARAHRLWPLLDHRLPWLTIQVGLELTRTHLALAEPGPARTVLAGQRAGARVAAAHGLAWSRRRGSCVIASRRPPGLGAPGR